MTEEERQAQLAPLQNLKPMTPLDDVDSNLSSDIATYAVLPEVYDSRDENLVTPVKFQNPFGICWLSALFPMQRPAFFLRDWDSGIFLRNILPISLLTAQMIHFETPQMTNISTKEVIITTVEMV